MSTQLIKPAKPSHPIHFWTRMPRAVSHSRLFYQITCPSKLFLFRHTKRCEPFPPFRIRLPAPPNYFWNKTPSAVGQSRNSSSDSSFIDNSSGINQFFSASDKFIFCFLFLLLLRKTHSQGLFLSFDKKDLQGIPLRLYLSALRSHTGTIFYCPLIFLFYCSCWVPLLCPCLWDLFEFLSLYLNSPFKYVFVKKLFYYCLLVGVSHSFYIVPFIVWFFFSVLSVSAWKNCFKVGAVLISILLNNRLQYIFNPNIDISTTQEIILFRPVLCATVLFFYEFYAITLFIDSIFVCQTYAVTIL